MKELGQIDTGNAAALQAIVQHLEAALVDIDRLQLMVIGAQISQAIEEIKALLDA